MTDLRNSFDHAWKRISTNWLTVTAIFALALTFFAVPDHKIRCVIALAIVILQFTWRNVPEKQ